MIGYKRLLYHVMSQLISHDLIFCLHHHFHLFLYEMSGTYSLLLTVPPVFVLISCSPVCKFEDEYALLKHKVKKGKVLPITDHEVPVGE